MAKSRKVLNHKLDEVVAALRVLASSGSHDDADTVEARAEALRAAGVAFEEQLEKVCLQYASVFEAPAGEDEDDDEDQCGGLSPGVRLSVQVREDFVLYDEPAFRASAARIFAERGTPPPDYNHDDLSPAGVDLLKLVDKIGLHEITFGESVAGLENAGGTTNVLVVDQALQEQPGW